MPALQRHRDCAAVPVVFREDFQKELTTGRAGAPIGSNSPAKEGLKCFWLGLVSLLLDPAISCNRARRCSQSIDQRGLAKARSQSSHQAQHEPTGSNTRCYAVGWSAARSE